MSDDGGLQDAVDAARARREEAERKSAERRATEEAADKEAHDQLRAAGLAFVRRTRSAGIPPDTVRVRTGFRERGFLSRRTVPVYEQRAAWVVTPYHPSTGYGASAVYDIQGVYVLEDGTVIYGSLAHPKSPERDKVPSVISQLASYLLEMEA